MIRIEELLKGTPLKSLPNEHRENLTILLDRLNKVRAAYGKPMTITSGYRSMEEHLRIYRSKGITDPLKIPLQSKHLFGQAADIFDPNKELQKWCLANEKKLEEIGLWMEDFADTPNWVHFQIVPPKSGKRWFKP